MGRLWEFVRHFVAAAAAEQCQMLADDHLLFYHPDVPAVLSTGAGRHWPHGRGIPSIIKYPIPLRDISCGCWSL